MSGAGASHIAFLAALEQAGDLAKPVCAFRMGRCGDDFVQRRWFPNRSSSGMAIS